jgi:hypothetical protein
VEEGVPVANNAGEAIFHAAKLLQLYEETESIEAVTEAATALLADRPSDHVREVAWFSPARADPGTPQTAPRPHRADATSVGFAVRGSRRRGLSPGRERTPNGCRKRAAGVNRQVPHQPRASGRLVPSAIASGAGFDLAPGL